MDFPSFALGAPSRSRPICSPAAWADAVNAGFLPLEHTPRHTSEFVAHIDVLDRMPSTLAMIRTQAHRVTRTPTLAARSDEAYFKAFWLLRGRCEIEQGDNRSILQPGYWTVYDTARPYSVEIDDGSQFLVLLMPQGTCREWQAFADTLCGRPLETDTCSRSALFALLSMFDAPAVGGQEEGSAVVDAVGRMLSASILTQACTHERGGRLERRLQEARRYVMAHLGDARLTPDRLAAALNMSRRALYGLFNALGVTPANFILEERLECCRTALSDSIHRHRTITEIALDNGFCDSAHFSRLFKRRYGVTPRQWRERS